MRSSPLVQLYLVRLRDFYRQPARVFWVYGFPTMLAIALGFAFKSRPPAPILVDLIEGSGSQAIKAAIEGHNAALKRRPASWPSALDLPPVEIHEASESKALERLKTGKTPLVIDPQGSEAWTYRFDPTRPEAGAARQGIDDILQEANGRKNPPHDPRRLRHRAGVTLYRLPHPWSDRSERHGRRALGRRLSARQLSDRQAAQALVATPMPRRDFLLALLGARLTFVLPDLAVLLLLGTLVFGMPIRGSLALVIAINLVGALAFAGIGLLVACRATTTETVSGLMNLVMLPMWLFSGVFFSSERFPEAAQPFIKALPLTQLVTAIRQVVLDGAGLVEVSPALFILTAWTVVTFSLALRFFRWT